MLMWWYMGRVMGKPMICICENKDADQLRGNGEADQHFCFRYIASVILLLPKLSRVMRKPTICICENKDADQLCGNREAD